MDFDLGFFAEVLVGGLLAGVMYSMVAFGFVLIYKASRVFNYAQGSMVLFSALTFAGFLEIGLNFWVAMAAVVAIMILLAFIIERTILRHLVNQSLIVLFMVTFGLSKILEGLMQLSWGGEARSLNLGISETPWGGLPILVDTFDLVAAGIAGCIVILLTLLFQFAKTGVLLRSVADDPLAAISMGISLKRMWIIVWAVSGIIALIAGLLWGARIGVQFSLIGVVMKAFPILILAGFTSINGVIVGGLLVGAAEKLSEVYIGPYLGGNQISIGTWFPYALALLICLIRPSGLFGEKEVVRV